MSITENIIAIRSQLPTGVQLVAVSKTHPTEAILEACKAGQIAFGESRPQELIAKQKQLPEGIEWHMIGHLQRNKVRGIIPFVTMIHSVDSARLLECIDDEARRIDRTVDVLFEVRIATEQTKSGWEAEELYYFLAGIEPSDYANVRFRGVMGIATNTPDTAQMRGEFTALKVVFEALRKNYFAHSAAFDTISMGMTQDWQLAVECGSTMVRIGSQIFGNRAQTAGLIK